MILISCLFNGLNHKASIIFHKYIKDKAELNSIIKLNHKPSDDIADLIRYNFEIKPAVKGSPAKLREQIIKQKKQQSIKMTKKHTN